MTLLEEKITTTQAENGWYRQTIKRKYSADWETGAAHFKRLGYTNWLTLPATIIPMTFNREKVLEFHPNAVVMVVFAQASTYNQPKGWTGEVQIPMNERQNEWLEKIEQVVYAPG